MEGDPQPAPESEAGQGETHAPEETQDGGEEENKDVDDASGEGKAAGEQTDVPEGNAEEAGDEEAERGEERGDQEEASTTNSDELSVMKSGAKDKISVMCVDVKSGANDMYLVAPDAVVWDAVGQFVKSKNIDPDSIVVRYHGQPVEVDKPFHMYSIKPGDAIELSLYQGGLPEGTEVEETDTGDENRQILEVEIPPGIDARTGTVVGHGRMVQVLVDWSQMERKKFLGGWRSKVRCVEDIYMCGAGVRASQLPQDCGRCHGAGLRFAMG